MPPWPYHWLLLALWSLPTISLGNQLNGGSTTVGCLYSDRLCQSNEWCHDDLAFGRCYSSAMDYYDVYQQQYHLDEVQLHDFSKELRRLFALGYRWGHVYTQCRLNTMLESVQDETVYDVNSCASYADTDLEGALRAWEGQEELDPEQVAIIKYTPSVEDPHGGYADEIYIPPFMEQRQLELRRNILGPGKAIEFDDIQDPALYNLIKTTKRDFFDPRYQLQQDDQELLLEEPRIYDQDDNELPTFQEYGSGHNDNDDPRGLLLPNQQQQQPMLYSEGGAEPEFLGFKRWERLDVKKPGPTVHVGSSHHGIQKKDPRGANPNPPSSSSSALAVLGLLRPIVAGRDQYVHVEFKDYLNNWKQGKDVIENVARVLHMELADFDEAVVHVKSVSFKVLNTNNRGYNASDVARLIDDLKDRITDLPIISVGVGDKARMHQAVFTRQYADNQTIVVALVCGILVALILATVVLALVRRVIKSRDKLKGLKGHSTTTTDTEAASKDYQDLCRARMAAKQEPTKRITSLTKADEGSCGSSRSSTSSWSEEPTLHNMDISTGHMVLSYMEDHLKNKDRLDQEWVALCAYVAEPCGTTAAGKYPEKNRSSAQQQVVPYDHARVVLNELSNAAGTDYINASSITDHDPRNPAYIAAQAPLPGTTADFWQMIWEQGAVVIVMLTRLTEQASGGGTVVMCHRYWPEDGSERYHNYEVHLVSEHIWCDDYLVRSFYLKNTKTGETRTVTQFHFLSWPDGAVPASTRALLEFRRKVNKSYRGRACPIVVHCSDGAGRTGTYCLIDMVLSRMAKGAKEIDIAATLEHLRDQRPLMVATKQQFEFVLTAVAEEVHAILKALPPPPAPAAVGTGSSGQAGGGGLAK